MEGLGNFIDLFIGAHVSKSNTKQYFYDWTISLLPKTIDQGTAALRRKYAGKYVEFQRFFVEHMGDQIEIRIPVFKEGHDPELGTEKYKERLNWYAKAWVIWDRRAGILHSVIQHFDVGVYDGVAAFIKGKNKEEQILEQIHVKKTVKIDNVKLEYEVIPNGELTRFDNIALLIKEVKHGYFDVRTHGLVDRDSNWKLTKTEYKIGRDVKIVMDKYNNILDIQQKETQYDWVKDWDWWRVVGPDGTRTICYEFVPYKTEEKDWLIYIELYWAYTHILRDMLNFIPLTWQYNFLMWEEEFNVVAGCRRAGKSMLSSYIITRELWRFPNTIKQTNRNVKALYIGPQEDKLTEVIDYITTSSQKFRLLKLIQFNRKDKRCYLYDELINARNEKSVEPVATCDFVGAKGFEPARGKASDYIFIDEAAFVPEDVWLNIAPIVTVEGARFFGISTIDWNTTRNWFYEKLVDTESGNIPGGFSMRVTIDDIDDRLVSKDKKELAKATLRNNQARYYAELYATFPDLEAVFDVEGVFAVNATLPQGHRWIADIIGYDPAKRSDTGAVILAEMRADEMWREYLFLLEEHWLKGEYLQQRAFIEALIERRKQIRYKQPLLIIDATQVWDVVAEMFGKMVTNKVWYVWTGNRPTIDDYGAWKVSKSFLVHMTQLLFERDYLKGHIWLTRLLNELPMFKAFKTPSGNTKYEAEAWHDDFVNAMMLLGFWFWFLHGKIYDEKMNYQELIDPDYHKDIDPKTWLYYPQPSIRLTLEEYEKLMNGSRRNDVVWDFRY